MQAQAREQGERRSPAPSSDVPGLKKGRACRNCKRMKERCIPLDNTLSICQRCHRLGKVCSTAPLRPAFRTPRSRLAQGLPTPASTPIPCISFGDSGPAKVNSVVDLAESEPSRTLAKLERKEQVRLFDHFWDSMSMHFPFLTLHLDGSHSSNNQEFGLETDQNDGVALSQYDQARQTSPFSTAACLMAALHRQVPIRKIVSRELLSSISNAVLLDGRKSLDLLQCIIIIEAWYPYHMIKAPQLNNLLHLAQSMAIDLNLAKYDVHTGLPSRIRGDIGSTLFGVVHGPWNDLAERRLTLGLYYLQAMYAITLRRLEYPRWSQRLDGACLYLQEHGNTSTDIHAIHVLRVLKLASRHLVPDGIRPSSSLNVRVYTRCFSDDLSAITQDIPPSFSDNAAIKQDVASIEIALRDLTLTTPDDTPTTSSQPEITEAFHSTHAVISAFFDHFLHLPLDFYPLGTTIIMGSQISQALEVLIKLHCSSTITNTGAFIDQLDPASSFTTIVERIAERFEEVYLNERQLFPHLETGMFAVYAIMARQWKKRFGEMLAAAGRESGDQQGENGQHDADNIAAHDAAITTGDGTTSQPAARSNSLLGTPGGMQLDDFLQWPSPFEDFGWP